MESEYADILAMPSLCPPGKKSWPELLGVNGEKAAVTIEKENKHVYAIIVMQGTPVTPGPADFRCNRVVVVVDKDGNVIRVPLVG